jgi:hypothetical protein
MTTRAQHIVQLFVEGKSFSQIQMLFTLARGLEDSPSHLELESILRKALARHGRKRKGKQP